MLLAQATPEISSWAAVVTGLGLLAGNVAVVYLFLNSQKEKDKTLSDAMTGLTNKIEVTQQNTTAALNKIADQFLESSKEDKDQNRQMFSEYHQVTRETVQALGVQSAVLADVKNALNALTVRVDSLDKPKGKIG